MGKPSNDPRSIVLNKCWICSALFSYNGGTEQREDHHIIPRAYGGVDGPTVTICDTHHTKTHRIAECLINQKNYFQYIKGEGPDVVKKLLWLASEIHNACLKMRNDPNKATSTVVTLNARHTHMVDALKKVKPKLRSREAQLLSALEAEYARHFVQ